MTAPDVSRGTPSLALDLAGHFDLAARLGGEQRDALGRIEQRLARPPMQPTFYDPADSATIDANGFGVVALGGPDQGHLWYVRRLIVGGQSWDDTAAGTAQVFVSAADFRLQTVAGGAFPITDLRDQADTLPDVAFYGHGEVPLHAPQRLYVRFVGATPEQIYTAAAGIEDFQEAADGQGWTR